MTPTVFSSGKAPATSTVTSYLHRLTIVERHVRLDVFVDGPVVQQSVIPEVVARQNVGVIQLLEKRNRIKQYCQVNAGWGYPTAGKEEQK